MVNPEQLHNIISLVLATVAVVDMVPTYRRDLMMLQQNSYRNDRYTRWFNASGESTSFIRITGCIALFFILVNHLPFGLTGIVSSCLLAGCFVSLVKRKYKKPLVMTRRARRIFITMMALSAVIAAGIWLLTHNPVTTCAIIIAEIIASPLILLLANLLLAPVEKSINRRYYNEARDMLQSMPGLKIIGITGSYGKTSTKHYLHRILSEQYDTLMTPGSFNTTLGVVRTIRENLKPYNEVFIVEMGAKQPGDIKEICDLVNPGIGIITAVGPQHLESFKTIERVQQTKFELADALPSNGLAVVNNDFPYIAQREVVNVSCDRYAVSNPAGANYTATEIKYSPSGTSFVVNGPDGYKLQLHTHLVGECNISNLMAAVIVARHLGVSDDKIQYAVEKIEQVEHRLNMKRTPGGITIIDDAFNSNPDGSRMAVEVLSRMTGGKRIIVTPGMIELGDRQYEANRELGRHIGNGVDIAIVVGQYNRDAIMTGITETDRLSSDSVHAVDTFRDAQKLLSGIMKSGDTVLYENDLPDTFK